jgi:hypothetical protein
MNHVFRQRIPLYKRRIVNRSSVPRIVYRKQSSLVKVTGQLVKITKLPKIICFIFICHDESLIDKYLKNYQNIVIMNVGKKRITKTYPFIIIINVRDLPVNIEIEPTLLTFTAWYAIVKNNLFTDFTYLCLFEYDVSFKRGFFSDLMKRLNTYPDVISFINICGNFTTSINLSVLQQFFDYKNIQFDYLKYNEKESWASTTNVCLKRNILNEFVYWYYPDYLLLKHNDPIQLSWYHERLFFVFIVVQKYTRRESSYVNHAMNNSHSILQNRLVTPRNYFLSYYDETDKYSNNLKKLFETVFKYDKSFQQILFRKSNIPKWFSKKFENILLCNKGGGYWLWKPCIICNILSNLEMGDLLFYLDSSYYFTEPFSNLYEQHLAESDIVLWKNKPNEGSNLKMKEYCKKSVLDKYECDKEFFQCWAGCIVIKKSEKSMNIMLEWLSMCCNYHDIGDTIQTSNYPMFVDHRHDQALLGVIAFKYKIPLHEFPKKYLQNVRYPY